MTEPAEDKEYRIERLVLDKIHDLETLYQAVYARSAPEGYFQRKYNTAYTGHEFVGYLAYNQSGVAIAYYGVIPCYLSYENKIVLAAQSADTMTHPQFRYKGMFVELSNRCFDLCRQEGIRIIFGFPNQNSFHGAIHKLGWTMTDTMDCFIIPVSAIPLESLAARFPLFSHIYRWYTRSLVKKNLKPARGIENSATGEGFAGVYRDEQYFHSKDYYQRIFIRLDGADLWIRINNGLIIGDMDLHGADFDSLIKKIKLLARKLGTKQILFHSSPQTSLHGLFSKRCPAVPSFPVLMKDFGSDIPPDKIKFSFGDIDIF